MEPRAWNPPTLEEAATLPGLAAGGIRLDPLPRVDLGQVYEAQDASRPELRQWMAWFHASYARTDTELFVKFAEGAWAEGTEFAFAIRAESSGRILGGCGLNWINRPNRFANLGYWVRTDAARRGVASTAARIAARFGFMHLGLDRIEIVAAVGNIPSQRAAEKAGARREGVLRHRLRIQDSPHDAVMFSLVPADLGL